MSPILSCEGLTRDYVRRDARLRRVTTRALDALTVSIDPGESVGYIGANGAGKSTTIKMAVGILRPTAGVVRTCGLDPLRRRVDVARQVGVVFGQRSGLWWDLPTSDSFSILSAIHRLSRTQERSRTDELVERLGLSPFWSTPVRQLSLGQRMRAEIAAALLHSPRLLVLDEPTIGLDVLAKARLREFLLEQRREHGTTLLLTTHDMGDVERLCDRLLLVDSGRLAYDGTLPGLIRRVGARRVLVVDVVEPLPALPAPTGPDGRALPVDVLPAEAGGLRHRIAFDAADVGPAPLVAAVSARVAIRDLTIEEPAIEDVVAAVYSGRGRGDPPDGVRGP